MTRTVNMHEAKTNLSKLIEAVENGDEIIIARDGQPAARITQLSTEKNLPRDWSPAMRAFLESAPDSEPIPEFLIHEPYHARQDRSSLEWLTGSEQTERQE